MTDLTANERELIQLFREVDEAGKMYIIQMLMCYLRFGADFYAEMKELLDRGDKKGMRECVSRWYALGLETVGEEGMRF